jgi:hypothetical protein
VGRGFSVLFLSWRKRGKLQAARTAIKLYLAMLGRDVLRPVRATGSISHLYYEDVWVGGSARNENSSFLKIIDLSLEFSKENGSVTYLDSPTLFLIFFKEKGWAVFS